MALPSIRGLGVGGLRGHAPGDARRTSFGAPRVPSHLLFDRSAARRRLRRSVHCGHLRAASRLWTPHTRLARRGHRPSPTAFSATRRTSIRPGQTVKERSLCPPRTPDSRDEALTAPGLSGVPWETSVGELHEHLEVVEDGRFVDDLGHERLGGALDLVATRVGLAGPGLLLALEEGQRANQLGIGLVAKAQVADKA